MPEFVFKYDQGKDIRWYASEPTELPNAQAASTAQAAGEKVTKEGNKFISWMKTSTSDGVCYALCAYWILLNSRGDDFWAWLGPSKRAAPQSTRDNPVAGDVVAKIRNVMRAQKQRVEKSGSIGKFIEMDEFLKANSALRNCKTILCNPMPIGNKAKGRFFYISLSGTRKNGTDFNHAVAASAGSDQALLFDPNYGEIKTSELGELSEFVEYLCTSAKYYNLRIDEMNYMAVT